MKNIRTISSVLLFLFIVFGTIKVLQISSQLDSARKDDVELDLKIFKTRDLLNAEQMRTEKIAVDVEITNKEVQRMNNELEQCQR